MVFPGLGTRLAGRPGAWAQMLLAALGFAGLTAWGLSVGIVWALEGDLGWGIPPWTWVGLAGLSLSAASWGWSLASGLAVLRDAKRAASNPFSRAP